MSATSRRPLQSGEEFEHRRSHIGHRWTGIQAHGRVPVWEEQERPHSARTQGEAPQGEAKGNEYVFIQCVGSREKDHPNCSRVCCTGTMTATIEIKKKDPAAKVFVLYRDIRTYGFREKYYKEASRLGVTFIRFEDKDKPRSRRRPEARSKGEGRGHGQGD